MKKISFLIPCYNEEESLPGLYAELVGFVASKATVRVTGDAGETLEQTFDMTGYEWEFLMVNDGSRDSTLDRLEELRSRDDRVSVLNLSRNFGKENAMLAGMDYFSGDALIIIDADLQDPLSVVPEMIYWWEKGYDDVYGRRLSRGKESRLRKAMSLQFYKIMQRTSNIDVLPNVGDFRLLDRRAVRAIISLRESQRYTKGLFCWVGFRKKGVDYARADRQAGKSSFNFKSLVNLAIEGIVGYSTMPLRVSTAVGIIVSLLAFIYLVVIIVKTLIWGEPVAGFPTLMCVILFLGGMQLLALGIIGEYIGRIFNETKNRPPYIVESFNGTTPQNSATE